MAEASILEFSQDITNQEAPPPLPAGDYNATIESVELKTSQTSGNEYLNIVFNIAPDDYPADFDAENNPDGVKLSYMRLNNDDTARNRYNVRKFCEAIGAKTGKKVDPNDWIGLSTVISVKHGTWEGEKRAEFGKIVGSK